MGQNTGTDVLSNKTFQKVLSNSPFADRADRIRSTLLEIHHQYLELKLTSQRSGPDVDFLLLEETAYYLSGIATTPGRREEIPPEIRSQSLAVSALIFEYLGDVASSLDVQSNLEHSQIYYLDACICNSLSLFEANAIALARKHLLKQQDLNTRLSTDDAQLGRQDCLNIIYAWLARDMIYLWTRRQRIENAINRTLSNLDQELLQGKVSRGVYSELCFWIALTQAILLHARYFQFGKEDYLKTSTEYFIQAIELSKKLSDPPLVWIVVALQICGNTMSANSVWKRLSGVCPDRYLRRLVTSAPPVLELWTSQIAALEARLDDSADNLAPLQHGYLDSRVNRVVIDMPTSSGKTLLAELAIIRTLFPEPEQSAQPIPNARCIYVTPTIALANQVESKLSSRLLPLGIRTTAILGGYDSAFLDDTIFSQTRVAIVTPEKLDMLARQDHAFVQQCRLFIFDEVHKLDSIGRGFTLEMLITWLKDFHPDTSKSKMLFISAVMPNILEIKAWIQPTEQPQLDASAIAISANWQPTRQIKGIFHVDRNDLIEKIDWIKPRITERWFGGHLTYVNDRTDLSNPRQIRRLIRVKYVYRKVIRKKTRKQELDRDSKLSFGIEEIAAEIAKKYVVANLDPVLVFFVSRDETKSFCRYLSVADYSPKDLSDHERELFEAFVQYIRERLGCDHPLSTYVEKGIAYHHGWLPKDVRAEIEYAFSRRWIRILGSTRTLIDGVNFPISTFILANYERILRKNVIWQLEKKDFQNMIGRAGRAVFDTEGQIIFVIPERPLSTDVTWQDYIFYQPDDLERQVQSSLNRQDFKASILSEMLRSMEEPSTAIKRLAIDPESLDKEYGPGAREIGETVLRLQAFLLALMDREILNPDNFETVIRFFNRTLFGQQQPTESLFNLVTHFTQTTGRTITTAEPNRQKRGIYGKIGMGFSSCHTLYEQATDYWNSYGRLYYREHTQHITSEFLEKVGGFAFSLPEVRPEVVRVPHKRPAQILNLSHGLILSDWVVLQMPLSDICSKYFSDITDPSESTEACANYLRDAFEYKAPWVLSAFYLFVSKIAQTENDIFDISPLARQLSMLPAYAKFGVNSPAAALFSMMGVSAREVAILLANHYNQEHPDSFLNFAQMLDWLLELEAEQVAEWFKSGIGNDTAGYIPRLFRFLDSIRSQEQSLDDLLPLEIDIAGWQFYRGPQVLSQLMIGDKIILKPDPLNPWDNYAVEVFNTEGYKLGFVPRSHSRAVYMHLASDLSLKCRIAAIDRSSKYRPIRMHLDWE